MSLPMMEAIETLNNYGLEVDLRASSWASTPTPPTPNSG